MAAVAGIVTGIAGFRSAAVLVAFTPFWDGVIYLLVFGAVILLFASFAWLAIPTLVGRMIDSQARASKLVRRIVLTAGATFLFLVLAGMAAGYGWAGAAYSGLVENFGEGWRQTSGLPSVLFGIALVFATLGLLSQLGLCLSIYRSLTSGRATIQEVLIAEREEAELMSDLAAAAAAMGVPEALVKRSAEARAKATGASVDEILAAWAGGAPAPAARQRTEPARRWPPDARRRDGNRRLRRREMTESSDRNRDT